MKTTNEPTIEQLNEECQKRLQDIFSHYLTAIPALELKLAMRHSLMNGGKRLRPMLIYASGTIFNAPMENLDVPAAAVEIIHTYSLIHDDLPSMDNADLRRGKASCHKACGEANAILAGDALNSLSIQVISDHPAQLSADRRLQMLSVLSQACGPYGMAAGQALDIGMLESNKLSVDQLENIYRLKTGRLIESCVELGRLASNDENDTHQAALAEFGQYIGLAFQIQDDILDQEQSSEELGKPQGIDFKNNKTTYPRLVGKQAAKNKVEQLYSQALESINLFGHQANLLRDLTTRMLKRNK